MGVGRATQQPSLLEGAVADLTIITGQKPIVTKADEVDRRLQAPRGPVDRRQGHAAGRPHVGVPRPARSASPSPASATSAACRRTVFDGRGNYTFGVTEQLIFPEIDYDKVDATRGMDITIVTTAVDDAGGQALLDAFGFPFKRGEDAMAPPRSAAVARSAARAPRRQEEVTGVREG